MMAQYVIKKPICSKWDFHLNAGGFSNSETISTFSKYDLNLKPIISNIIQNIISIIVGLGSKKEGQYNRSYVA